MLKQRDPFGPYKNPKGGCCKQVLKPWFNQRLGPALLLLLEQKSPFACSCPNETRHIPGNSKVAKREGQATQSLGPVPKKSLLQKEGTVATNIIYLLKKPQPSAVSRFSCLPWANKQIIVDPRHMLMHPSKQSTVLPTHRRTATNIGVEWAPSSSRPECVGRKKIGCCWLPCKRINFLGFSVNPQATSPTESSSATFSPWRHAL